MHDCLKLIKEAYVTRFNIIVHLYVKKTILLVPMLMAIENYSLFSINVSRTEIQSE